MKSLKKKNKIPEYIFTICTCKGLELIKFAFFFKKSLKTNLIKNEIKSVLGIHSLSNNK